MKSIKFNTLYTAFFCTTFLLSTLAINGQIGLGNCDSYELLNSSYVVKSQTELKATLTFSSSNADIIGTATIEDNQHPEIVWDSVVFSTQPKNTITNQNLRLVFTGTSGSIITLPDDYELAGRIVINHQGIEEQNCEFSYTCQKSEDIELISTIIAKTSNSINENTNSLNKHLNNTNVGTVLGSKNFTMTDQLINVYPNPAPDYVFVQSGILKENITATIYDAQGVAVRETNISKPIVRVETMNLKSGLYFLLVSDGAKHLNLTKLIIE